MPSSRLHASTRNERDNSMEENPLRLKRLHHIEFLVGNAKQAAHFYNHAFGFSLEAYAGLETGRRDATSYVLKQGDANFILTAPLLPEGIMSEHVKKHGDGVRDIAFEVEDADRSFELAMSSGAQAAENPQTLADEYGEVRRAAVRTYGDTIHSFLSFQRREGAFLPGYKSMPVHGKNAGIRRIDHIVGNVEFGKMNTWADWYNNVMGFRRYMTFDDKDISTEYSALMSMVMANDSAALKMPINEPAPGRRKSQIQEYLDFYQGPGVQHIALLTEDIVKSVDTLRASGVSFLKVPDSYYEALPERVGTLKEDIEDIRSLGILVDRDQEGYLLQIFTNPVSDRPTLFYEIIQRSGSRGFGKGNFKALFEAIEREQARRGNL
jgi:4-hydroxyphenylpyruvate dioxygenase